MTAEIGDTLAAYKGHRLVAYQADDGELRSAVYTVGGLVKPHPEGWHTTRLKDGALQRTFLTARTLAELARVAPTSDMPPLLDLQAGLFDDSDDEPAWAPDPEDDGLLEIIDWTQVHDPADDIVDRLVIPGRWLQLVAGPKVGKSTLEAWIAIAVSEGYDPFDNTPATPHVVLYCDGEMGRDDLEQLIRDTGHDPVSLANLRCSTERARLDTTTGAKRLLDRVAADQAKLVILDGLNGFVAADADENRSDTWRALFEHTVDPLKRRGVAVVSGDNLGKDPGRGSRGSSAKTDKADAVIVVKRTDDGVKLKASHARGGAYLDELDLAAEGFDRAAPIRYWRASGSWPAGTAAVVDLLDTLKVPVDHSRDKVRKRLAAEAAEAVNPDDYRVRNDVLSAAIRYRKTPGDGSGTALLRLLGTDPGTDPEQPP